MTANDKNLFDTNKLPKGVTMRDIALIVRGTLLFADIVEEILSKFLAGKGREDDIKACLETARDKIEILHNWEYRLGYINPPYP